MGLASRVDQVFTSALVGWEKPNRRVFEHVLASYGEPEQAWMVGDNPVADVAGAEAVGLQAILVRGPRRRTAGLQARGLVEAARMVVACGRADNGSRRPKALRSPERTATAEPAGASEPTNRR